jgi:23S rRNA (adenine2503-C2)-methyltransferase
MTGESALVEKKDILSADEKELSGWFQSLGGKAFWARQTLRWVFEKRVLDPSLYTDLPPSFRTQLAENFSFELPQLDCALKSGDGSEKILLKLLDGSLVECMLMPTPDRVTICVSSQVGCKMACSFCQTGRLGFMRNLTQGEILAQVLWCFKKLRERGDDRRITNVVFMGMGEPLHNYDNVLSACRILVAEHYFAMSRHKVTVSTCGLVPEIRKMAAEFPMRLAISLHSADQQQRMELMPIAGVYPLEDLKQALLEYPAGRDGITFEYIMLAGVNDSLLHAKKLVKFVHGLKAKVNLIPMNEHPGLELKPSNEEALRAFQKYLSDRSIVAPVRYSKGADVSGACGQMAAKRKDELGNEPTRKYHPKRRSR